MLNFDAPGAAQSVLSVCGDCLLVEAEFSTGTERVTNTSVDIQALSQTWLRLGDNLLVEGVDESESNNNGQLTVSLGISDPTVVAKAIGPASVYRGRKLRVYLQLLNEHNAPIGAPILRWVGQMDHMTIDRNAEGGGVARMSCSKAGMARSSRYEGLRLSHAQRLSKYPGDNSYQYITALIEKPVVWLSRAFQRAIA